METETIDGKKKLRRSTPSGRAQVLEEFRRGGLTRIAFSRSHNVALSTLSKWLTRAKCGVNTSAAVVFKELRVPQDPPLAATPRSAFDSMQEQLQFLRAEAEAGALA
jgi:transposase-like protein